MSQGDAEKAAASLLSAETLVVVREKQGKTQAVDIRPYIAELSVLSESPDLPLKAAPNRVSVAFSLHIPGSGGCKPSEVVRALSPNAADDAWIVRTEVSLEKACLA